MALETELKLRVESHEIVRQRLTDVGAGFLETVLETNRIYDLTDGSLRRRGCGLRLRSVERMDGKQGRSTLTFKGPRRPTALKSREELEVDVADVDTLARLLEGLGFEPILSYQKCRESWELDRCRVELDEPPRIGKYVEIEGPDEPTIRAVQRKLGLNDARDVPTSYVGMLIAYCETHGIADRTLDLPEGRAGWLRSRAAGQAVPSDE